MSILQDADLEFARIHIAKYYDSDFFPKPVEFGAIWMHWDEVKAELISRNVQKIAFSSPRVLAASKPGGAFRIVHQLEPLDSIVYTALVASACEHIEIARVPKEEHVACSYRISKLDGSFFSGGTGWPEFTSQTENLAASNKYVLILDISDYYNQIYLHRVNNAVHFAHASLHNIADDIEYFLTTINAKCSQGIPVGPAASIVLAEAVLMDVDSHIANLGFKHTRYVDDFRVFANEKNALEKLLEKLTFYLYDTHRLSISSEKTFLMLSSEFIDKNLHADMAEERAELFEKLQIFNPYSDEFEEFLLAQLDDDSRFEEIQSRVVEAVGEMLEFEKLDLGVARAVIRAAKREKVSAVAEELLAAFCFLSPVINDLCLYLDNLTDEAFAQSISRQLEICIESHCMQHDLVRYWIGWYVAKHIEKFNSKKLREFVYSSGWIEISAIAAVREKNIAWVRERKTGVLNHSPRERRAIIYAGQILPQDEREAWLKGVVQNATTKMDNWTARWVMTVARKADASGVGFAF